MRVEATGREDARGDGGARAAFADRDDRLVTRKVGSRRVRAGGTGCSGCLRCSPCRARLSRGRRSARRLSRAGRRALDGDELELLRAAAEHVAGDVEKPDRAQPADRGRRLGLVRRATTTGWTSSSTNAAFVAKRVPETGTLSAPERWPAANASTGLHVEHLRAFWRGSELCRLGRRRRRTARG